jgi:hypothetical protein
MAQLLNIIKFGVLLISIGYWAISFSSGANSWAIKKNIFPYDYRYGDLYRLSNLPQFKQRVVSCLNNDIYKNTSVKDKPNLYIIGDSYTHLRIVHKANFDVNEYTRMHWDSLRYVKLDITKTNILLVESVERSIWHHYGETKSEIAQVLEKSNTDKITPEKSKFVLYFEQLLARFENNCKGMEERIWQTAFNYDAILYMKEIKATLNLNLFDRVADKTQLSDDGKDIYYFEEADVNRVGSSIYKIKNSDIENIVENINESELAYKKMGFDKVFYTFIPNKASITNYRKSDYNHLLERILANGNFKVKHIDVLQEFSKSPEKYYYKSDTHWNCLGIKYWTSLVNEELKKTIIKKP